MFFTLFGANHRFVAHLFDKIKPHVRNRSGTVQPPLCFHLADDMFQGFLFIFIQLQAIPDQDISLCKLGSCKPHRNLRFFCMIFNKMHDRMQTPMHGTAVFLTVAKIHPSGALLILCHMNRMGNQLFNAFVFGCGNRNNRNAQKRLHLINQNGTAVFPHLIHHIKRQHHRDIQLHQLHRQIKVPFDICRIHDIDNSFWVLLQQKVSRHNLFAGIGGHRINAREIRYQRIFLSTDLTVLSVYRNTRKVSDMLI